jgi:hypothetical protein
LIVAGVDGLDRQQPDARPGEDRFDRDRAGDEEPDDQPEEGQRRNRRVLEGVLPEHFPLRQTLRPRQLDVLAVQHVEHRRAGEAHERRHREPAECQAGQDDVGEGSLA